MFILDTIRAILGSKKVLTRGGHIVNSAGLVGDKIIIAKSGFGYKNTYLADTVVARSE